MRGVQIEFVAPVGKSQARVNVRANGITIAVGTVDRSWLRNAADHGYTLASNLQDPIDDQIERHARMPFPSDDMERPLICWECSGLVVAAQTPSGFEHADDDETTEAVDAYVTKMRAAQRAADRELSR
jgi:hypothetical protein